MKMPFISKKWNPSCKEVKVPTDRSHWFTLSCHSWIHHCDMYDSSGWLNIENKHKLYQHQDLFKCMKRNSLNYCSAMYLVEKRNNCSQGSQNTRTFVKQKVGNWAQNVFLFLLSINRLQWRKSSIRRKCYENRYKFTFILQGKKLITARKFIVSVLNTFPNSLNEHGFLQKNGGLMLGVSTLDSDIGQVGGTIHCGKNAARVFVRMNMKIIRCSSSRAIKFTITQSVRQSKVWDNLDKLVLGHFQLEGWQHFQHSGRGAVLDKWSCCCMLQGASVFCCPSKEISTL